MQENYSNERNRRGWGRQHGDVAKTDLENAVSLDYSVRDEIRYDPYKFQMDESNYIASNTLRDGAGFCVPKAIVLAVVT